MHRRVWAIIIIGVAGAVSGRAQVALAPSELTLGPYLQFTGTSTAVVRWHTQHPIPSIIELLGSGSTRRFENLEPKQIHALDLTELEHNAVYRYRIVLGDDIATPEYDCETTFNYTLPDIPSVPSPYAETPWSSVYAAAAEHILAVSGIRDGYCLVAGIGEGRLIDEIAKRSNLHIVGIDTDEAKVNAVRNSLRHAGLYGGRATVQQVDAFDHLPWTSCFADLIVSDMVMAGGCVPGDFQSWFALLRPGGGSIFIGQPQAAPIPLDPAVLKQWAPAAEIEVGEKGVWLRAIRPELEGVGKWTHQYGSPDNSARSGDGLLGATRTEELQAQWVGQPGSRATVDRNPRTPSPLFSNGRLFTQGFRRIIALNAYNGAILWSLEIPYFERYNLPRDCSNWCADDQCLYLAVQNQCWQINAANGMLMQTYPVTAPEKDTEGYDWGYVARVGDTVFGSAIKQCTVYTNFRGKNSMGWYDSPIGPVTYKVGSDTLFAYAAADRTLRWKYEKGVILNSTITIADGTVYFAECRHPEVKAAETRRLSPKNLWEDLHLVALNANTGAEIWERPLNDLAKGIVTYFLLHADNTLILAASDNRYNLFGFDAATGEMKWSTGHEWTGKDHSGHMQHPAVVGHTVFLEPCGYDIATGNKLTDGMGRHEGCATYAATEGALLYRGEGRRIALWDVQTGQTTSWLRLRPSCWLSTIAGGGMVLSPEGGGGCSCGGWMETSIAFIKR